MIFQLTFEDGTIDWCTAKDQLHLLKSYDAECKLSLQDLESIIEISEEKSKTIMVANIDYDKDFPDNMPEKFSLWELAINDNFCIIASTEFDNTNFD